MAFIAVAFLTGIVLAGAPSGAYAGSVQRADKKCHNPFRMTKGSVLNPQLDIRLKIKPDEWPALRRIFRSFSQQHGWSDRDATKISAGEYKLLAVDICSVSEPINISTEDYLFQFSPGNHSDLGWDYVTIDLYTTLPPATWHQIAREFVGELATKWPNQWTIHNGGGYPIPPPTYLKVNPR